jgi:ribose-phosphate pyrophosphokinase
MKKILFALPGNETLGAALEKKHGYTPGLAELRNFPDGESYVRVYSDVRDCEVYLLCTFHHPDFVFLPLYFLARQVKEMGASKVILLSPYLAYLRQDMAFRPGECITSVHFAQLLSSCVDALVTIDPHLHRYSSLDEIYIIPSNVKSSTVHIADWISKNVGNPVIIGPDAESEQWVSDLAGKIAAPFLILAKNRKGDRLVDVSVPNLHKYMGQQVVLVDDIISTGRTMIETIRHVLEAGFSPPTCIAVHAVFSPGAYEELLGAGAGTIVTCNTILHASNQIDVSDLLLPL